MSGIRVLKSRTVGETGFAGYIKYDPKTTLLNEYFCSDDDDDDLEEGEENNEDYKNGNF